MVSTKKHGHSNYSLSTNNTSICQTDLKSTAALLHFQTIFFYQLLTNEVGTSPAVQQKYLAIDTTNQTNYTNQPRTITYNFSIHKLKVVQAQFFVCLDVPSLYVAISAN